MTIRLILTASVCAVVLLGAAPVAAQLLGRPYAPREVKDPEAVNGKLCDAMVEIEAIAAHLEKHKRDEGAQRFVGYMQVMRDRFEEIREALMASPKGSDGTLMIQAETLLPLRIDAENQLNHARQQMYASERSRWTGFVSDRMPTINVAFLALRVAIGMHPTGVEGGLDTTCVSCSTDEPSPESSQVCVEPANPLCVCTYADGPRRETICTCRGGRWLCSNHMSKRPRKKSAPP